MTEIGLPMKYPNIQLLVSFFQTERRIVLIGKTGTGKSSVGNNMLKKATFKSKPSAKCVTTECTMDSCTLPNGRKMFIVDTPGFFDTEKSVKDTSMEILRCVVLSSPGPHIFMLVLKIGRFTEEDLQSVEHLQSLFGESVMKYVIVVFTCRDDLDKKEASIEEYMQDLPETLNAVLKLCNWRYVAINNDADEANLKVDMEKVMTLIDKTVAVNEGHYTSEMYATAERIMQEKMQKIEEEKNRSELDIKDQQKKLAQRETELAAKIKAQKKAASVSGTENAAFEDLLTEFSRQSKRNEKDQADLRCCLIKLQLRDAREEARKDFESEKTVGGLLWDLGSLLSKTYEKKIHDKCSVM